MSGKSYTNHTSLRIADPDRSLKFYEENFGMTLIKKKTKGLYTSFLLALTGPNSLYKDAPYFARNGMLQLVHNQLATAYNFVASNGNTEPNRGFGHICFSVNDLNKTCAMLDANNVQFKKRPEDGRQHDIAFVLDPDGYWIELFENKLQEEDSTRLNHAMIRVKDKDLSLEFYTKKLGLSVVHVMDFPSAKFTLYFLSYEPEFVEQHPFIQAEGLIELTYNYDSEKDETLRYHNGNEPPVGFHHLGITTADPNALVENANADVIEQSGNVYTIVDPDQYHIQILPIGAYFD